MTELIINNIEQNNALDAVIMMNTLLNIKKQ